MIVVVADAFSDTYTGGAELTTDAFLERGFYNYKKIHSRDLNSLTIDLLKNEKWIFGNFSFLSDKLILEIVKKVKDYNVIEYDYKYCKYRLKNKHINAEGECNCPTSRRGKVVALFLAKAKNLFFMSQGQKDEYESIFPFLSKSSSVLSSSFKKETLKFIESLDTKNKNDKYIILGSDSWVKGTKDGIKYATEHNLKYEVVSGLEHKDLLRKLAASKGLIFLAAGLDTCPRITIEARLLNCELVLNDNVQHKDEPWFKSRESIVEYVNTNKEIFYDKCLKEKLVEQKIAEKTKFHFVVPCYNVQSWLYRCLASIKKQTYDNYTVTVVNDVSTDNTANVFDKHFKGDERYKIINNKEKNYALKNIDIAIQSINSNPDDIIIVLDGDDWLSSEDVLNLLNKIYVEEKVFLTYGSYQYYPMGTKGVEPSEYPKSVIDNNDYRNDEWRASHLRTFKALLWDKIDKKDLMDDDGEYYKMTYDQAMMLPMLEMVGPLARYVPEVLHVYNRSNPLNVDKIKQAQQYTTKQRIRRKKKYSRIDFEN